MTQTAFDFESLRAARSAHVVTAFDPEAERARDASMLERRLAALLESEVALTLTNNGRTMVSARHRSGLVHVRLHHMFLAADDNTLRAVGRYLKDGHGTAASHLQHYIRSHGELIKRAARNTSVRVQGHHHDLRATFETLNAHYFDGLVAARIGWGRMGRPLRRRSRRRSIKLGSYRGRDALIRVHPLLDAAWVPGFFVEYIVYHEMVHHVVDMPLSNGRRCLHGAEFRAREQQYARYDEAIAWEQANLDRLLSG